MCVFKTALSVSVMGSLRGWCFYILWGFLNAHQSIVPRNDVLYGGLLLPLGEKKFCHKLPVNCQNIKIMNQYLEMPSQNIEILHDSTSQNMDNVDSFELYGYFFPSGRNSLSWTIDNHRQSVGSCVRGAI